MRKTLMVFTIAGLVFAFAIPQSVNASISGVTEINCKTVLLHWPTASGSGTCNKYPVGAFGVGAGVTTTNAPYAIVAANALTTSSFTYSEPCPVPGVPLTPLVGFANGTIYAKGLKAVVSTKQTTATVSEKFSWTRVGLVAVVTTSGAAVAFGTGAVARAAAPGAAVGTFVPLSAPTKNTCPTGGALTAEVVSVGVGAA